MLLALGAYLVGAASLLGLADTSVERG